MTINPQSQKKEEIKSDLPSLSGGSTGAVASGGFDEINIEEEKELDED
jgi:hypothetical protein